MKKIFLFLFILSSLNLQSQQARIILTAPGDFKRDVTSFHKYGKNVVSDKTEWGNMQFAYTANLKKVTYGIELTQYDEQLKELKTLSIDNGKEKLGPFEPTIHYGKDAIYVQYYKFMDNDKIKMYVTKVNPGDLSVIATREIIEYDQKNQAIWGTVKTIMDTRGIYTDSEDGKFSWIIHTTPTNIFSTVIDKDINIIQQTQSMPVTQKKFSILNTYIGNDGNKALIYEEENPENRDLSAKGILFQSANEKGSFQSMKFPAGAFPGISKLQPSKNNKKLYIAGDYFGADRDQGSTGVFLGEVNITSGSITEPVLFPYTEELKQRILDLQFASRSKGEIVIKDFHINYRIAETENGTIILSSNLESSTTTYSSTTPSTRTLIFRGPIVHIFIKPGGNAVMTLIPKKQYRSSTTNFFNYVYKDKLVCIYADLPKFQAKEFLDKEISLVSAENGLVPVVNIYDSEGKLISKKMLLENSKEVKGLLMIGGRSQFEDGKYIIPIGDNKASMTKYYTIINHLGIIEIL